MEREIGSGDQSDIYKQVIREPDERLLWRKSYFRNLWGSSLPIHLRFKFSNRLFVGREAFIFAAGPSLKSVDMAALRGRLSRALVISIKQSIQIVGEQADAMVMNFCNFSSYDWDAISCPVFWATFDCSHPELIKSKGARCDVAFEVVENSSNDVTGFSQSTAGREHWSNLLSINSQKAFWGPGLMYEIAIPLALLTGVSHIYLVGWDIGTLSHDPSGAFLNEHFYDQDLIQLKTKITNLEMETIARSTKSLRVWLEDRGVRLSIVSDRSLADSTIERANQWLIQ
jgi:hypothetical protein